MNSRVAHGVEGHGVMQAKSSVNDKQTARQSASAQGGSRMEGFSDYVPN